MTRRAVSAEQGFPAIVLRPACTRPPPTVPPPRQISGGDDKLMMEKLVDAVAITIRLHSQVEHAAAVNSRGGLFAWRASMNAIHPPAHLPAATPLVLPPLLRARVVRVRCCPATRPAPPLQAEVEVLYPLMAKRLGAKGEELMKRAAAEHAKIERDLMTALEHRKVRAAPPLALPAHAWVCCTTFVANACAPDAPWAYRAKACPAVWLPWPERGAALSVAVHEAACGPQTSCYGQAEGDMLAAPCHTGRAHLLLLLCSLAARSWCPPSKR